jgi:hypothetical protein
LALTSWGVRRLSPAQNKELVVDLSYPNEGAIVHMHDRLQDKENQWWYLGLDV